MRGLALLAGRPTSFGLGGLIFGSVFLLVLIPLQPPAIREEIQSLHGHLLTATASFWALFAVSGTVISRFLGHLDRRSEDMNRED
jgi:hypothetical protein